MQAIIVKYIPATNFKPSRLKAISEARSLTMSFNSAEDLSPTNPMAAVALALARKIGWTGTLASGGLPKNGGEVFCFVEAHGHRTNTYTI